jgi:hypothetical protein
VFSNLTRKQFLKQLGGVSATAAAFPAFAELLQAQQNSQPIPGRNIKWAYMDHWSLMTPRGRSSPYISLRQMERYIRQLSVLGFTGFDTFNFRLPALIGMFGRILRSFFRTTASRNSRAFSRPIPMLERRGLSMSARTTTPYSPKWKQL